MSNKFTSITSGGNTIPVWDKDAHTQIGNKLDTTAFSTVSGTFLTAHQSLSNYATKTELNNYQLDNHSRLRRGTKSSTKHYGLLANRSVISATSKNNIYGDFELKIFSTNTQYQLVDTVRFNIYYRYDSTGTQTPYLNILYSTLSKEIASSLLKLKYTYVAGGTGGIWLYVDDSNSYFGNYYNFVLTPFQSVSGDYGTSWQNNGNDWTYYDQSGSGDSIFTSTMEGTEDGIVRFIDMHGNFEGGGGGASLTATLPLRITNNVITNNGSACVVNGSYAWAEGYNTSALGEYSHAEGRGTKAANGHSHAEGYLTTAASYNSHAEGISTYAGNNAAHAEGSATSANGTASHAEGVSTYTSGYASHVEGISTKNADEAAHVQGKYNKTSANAAFVIGNGTSTAARHDAMVVDWNGNLSAAGTINGIDLSDQKELIAGSGISLTDTTSGLTVNLNNETVLWEGEITAASTPATITVSEKFSNFDRIRIEYNRDSTVSDMLECKEYPTLSGYAMFRPNISMCSVNTNTGITFYNLRLSGSFTGTSLNVVNQNRFGLSQDSGTSGKVIYGNSYGPIVYKIVGINRKV